MERKMLAARKELVDTLKSVISDSADDILSKTLDNTAHYLLCCNRRQTRTSEKF
jgi:hypothetical protein